MAKRIEDGHASGFVKFSERNENHKGDIIESDIAVRRVISPDRGEEVQISLGLFKCFKHSNQSRSLHGYLHLTPDQAVELAKAITDLWKKQAA